MVQYGAIWCNMFLQKRQLGMMNNFVKLLGVEKQIPSKHQQQQASPKQQTNDLAMAWCQVMAFDLDMISIGCVAPMEPVMKFSTRCLDEIRPEKVGGTLDRWIWGDIM